MKILFGILLVLIFTACGDANMSQNGAVTTVRCNGGQQPTSVTPSSTAITVVCPDNSVHVVDVASYNGAMGSQYSSGQDMMLDYLFLNSMFGPHYYGSPWYHSYYSSPYHSYVPSSYVRQNITIYHQYGNNAARAMRSSTFVARSSYIRTTSGYTRSTTTYSSNRGGFSTFHSSSGGRFRRR